jgi:hypothetical protein
MWVTADNLSEDIVTAIGHFAELSDRLGEVTFLAGVPHRGAMQLAAPSSWSAVDMLIVSNAGSIPLQPSTPPITWPDSSGRSEPDRELLMLERLRGLDHVEQTACLIAERTLGATATANEVPPKQGVVDALFDYPDGRRGAVEVTQLATDGGASLQLQSLLRRTGFGWPFPGKWWWWNI